jgi:hypothetical protein
LNGRSHFVAFVKPLSPQTAPLPIGDRHVAPTPWKALPPHFAQSEPFVAPPKFGLIVAVPPTMANWTPTPGAKAVTLKYAAPDFVNQVRPTLAALPAPAGFELVFRPPNAQPQSYAPTDFSGPAKFGLVFVPPPSTAGWLATLGANAVALKYAAPDFVNQVRPTLAALPAPAGFELALIAANARPPCYRGADFSAPPKFGLIPVATATLSAWLPSSAAPGAQPLEYAPSLLVASDKIIVAAPPTVYARWENSQIRQGGTPPVPKHYVASVRQLLPAPAQVLPLTLASWLANDARGSLVLEYLAGDYAAPIVSGTIAPVPVGVSFVVATPRNAQPLDYALTTIVSPDKTLPQLPASPFLAWRSEDAYVPKSDWYVMGDTLTAPSFVASVKQAYASAVPGVTALPGRFSGVTSGVSAPEKFGLTQTVLPTLASWSATEGARAIVLRYAGPDWNAPAKFNLITIATPTIASWLATLGEKAVQLRYDPTSWTAPARFGLAFVAATPTVAAWSSTIGAKAMVLRYAPTNFVTQARPTLALLPIGLALAEPAASALPQFYASVDWTGPSAAQAAGAAVLEAALMRVFSALQALGGFSTFSAAEVSRFVIVSK